MSTSLQRDPARKTWQDMMKESSAEVIRAAGGDNKPKTETEDSYLVLVNQVGLDTGAPQGGMTQNGIPETLSMVTSSV